MQQRCPGYHMNISETPTFYETDITDENMTLERKIVPIQYFKFECVETFRKHSSFVFPWPLHRRDQCWPHRCRRGWRSERKQRFSLPTHILLNFLKSVWILTSQFSCVQIFTCWGDVPRESTTVCRIHPQSGTRDESRDKMNPFSIAAVGSCKHIWKMVGGLVTMIDQKVMTWSIIFMLCLEREHLYDRPLIYLPGSLNSLINFVQTAFLTAFTTLVLREKICTTGRWFTSSDHSKFFIFLAKSHALKLFSPCQRLTLVHCSILVQKC